MPGIPRSKGCINCRERKIKRGWTIELNMRDRSDEPKCDQAKPHCNKCEASGRCCKGYQKKEMIFIHCASPEELKRIDCRKAVCRSRPGAIPRGPHLEVVYRDHFLALFLQEYLPKGQDDATYNSTVGLSLYRYLPEVTYQSEALRESLAALSITIVGRAKSDQRLIKHSHEVYGKALKAISKALGSPETRSSQNTMAAMMALSNYELWQPSHRSADGWMNHVRGASECLRARGPLKCDEMSDKICGALDRHVRISTILDDWGRRKATFLADKEWQQSRDLDANLNDLLVDILVHLPGLLEQTDMLFIFPASDSDYASECIGLLQRFIAMRQQLEVWYQQVEFENLGALYWDEPARDELPNFPFASRITFASKSVAQMLLLYWTAQSVIYTELERIISSCESAEVYQSIHEDVFLLDESNSTETSFSQESVLQTLYTSKALELSDLVMRSEAYCCGPQFGLSGIQSVTFSIWAAMQIYEGREEQKFRYCTDRCRHLGASKGLFFFSMMARTSMLNYPGIGGSSPVLESETTALMSWKDFENGQVELPCSWIPVQGGTLRGLDCIGV